MVSLASRRHKRITPNLSIDVDQAAVPLADLDDADEEYEPLDSKPAAEFKCERVGRFANPNSCEKYYFCWDAVHDHAVFTCPYFECFNPKTQSCQIDFSVCATAPKCQFDRQLLPNREDNSTYFECRMATSSNENESDKPRYRLYKEDCGYKSEFNADFGYCKLTAENDDDSEEIDDAEKSDKMECKDAGVFIDQSDESRYYECIVKTVTYARIHQTCPYDHVFSMADKRCIKLEPNEK